MRSTTRASAGASPRPPPHPACRRAGVSPSTSLGADPRSRRGTLAADHHVVLDRSTRCRAPTRGRPRRRDGAGGGAQGGRPPRWFGRDHEPGEQHRAAGRGRRARRDWVHGITPGSGARRRRRRSPPGRSLATGCASWSDPGAGVSPGGDLGGGGTQSRRRCRPRTCRRCCRRVCDRDQPARRLLRPGRLPPPPSRPEPPAVGARHRGGPGRDYMMSAAAIAAGHGIPPPRE